MPNGTAHTDTFLFETAATVSRLADAAGPAGEKAASLTLIDPHLLYDSKTGALYYDPDGSGLHAMIRIAVIGAVPSPEAPDFEVL